MKTPILTPENQLPELECENGWQAIKIDFVDDANDLLIEVVAHVFVTLEKSGGDGYITPDEITAKTDVQSIEYNCFDFDGKRVIDEDGVIYKELENRIKWEYEN